MAFDAEVTLNLASQMDQQKLFKLKSKLFCPLVCTGVLRNNVSRQRRSMQPQPLMDQGTGKMRQSNGRPMSSNGNIIRICLTHFFLFERLLK